MKQAIFALVIGVPLIVGVFQQPKHAPQVQAREQDTIDGADEQGLASTRRFPYSVVGGGVHNAKEAQQATDDKVVKLHYTGIDTRRLEATAYKADTLRYVSYRILDKIFWTAKQVTIKAGEPVLCDGKNYIRTRCGNRISEHPMQPTRQNEPSEEELDTAVPVDSGLSTEPPSLTNIASNSLLNQTFLIEPPTWQPNEQPVPPTTIVPGSTVGRSTAPSSTVAPGVPPMSFAAPPGVPPVTPPAAQPEPVTPPGPVAPPGTVTPPGPVTPLGPVASPGPITPPEPVTPPGPVAPPGSITPLGPAAPPGPVAPPVLPPIAPPGPVVPPGPIVVPPEVPPGASRVVPPGSPVVPPAPPLVPPAPPLVPPTPPVTPPGPVVVPPGVPPTVPPALLATPEPGTFVLFGSVLLLGIAVAKSNRRIRVCLRNSATNGGR